MAKHCREQSVESYINRRLALREELEIELDDHEAVCHLCLEGFDCSELQRIIERMYPLMQTQLMNFEPQIAVTAQ